MAGRETSSVRDGVSRRRRYYLRSLVERTRGLGNHTRDRRAGGVQKLRKRGDFSREDGKEGKNSSRADTVPRGIPGRARRQKPRRQKRVDRSQRRKKGDGVPEKHWRRKGRESEKKERERKREKKEEREAGRHEDDAAASQQQRVGKLMVGQSPKTFRCSRPGISISRYVARIDAIFIRWTRAFSNFRRQMRRHRIIAVSSASGGALF